MKDVSILGCGWLGLPLAQHLITEEFKIKGSTTKEEKIPLLKTSGIEAHIVDISSKETDFKDFLNVGTLVVAITSKDIDAFKNLVKEIEGSRVKNVLFISSTSVYPSLNREVFEEDANENSPLGMIENIFKSSTKFVTTVIRFAGLLGYNRQPGNWFSNRKIPHPNGFVNMIHRDDCIAIITQILKENVWNETFSACTNHHPTREEFYKYARLSIKKEPPVFDDSLELKYKIVNSNKLIQTLNYQFIHQNLLAI
ncbi:NAD-dependent epimerase/dehydratase family protein [Tenacibaculum sp. 190130A14a]|uniref:NAD-dependent epimerase/dehydratase family protein n=1 Tax=Tenacibaculum polynesiense TaxID=3137857 RepID=A0ABM9PCF7_9FLAO